LKNDPPAAERIREEPNNYNLIFMFFSF